MKRIIALSLVLLGALPLVSHGDPARAVDLDLELLAARNAYVTYEIELTPTERQSQKLEVHRSQWLAQRGGPTHGYSLQQATLERWLIQERLEAGNAGADAKIYEANFDTWGRIYQAVQRHLDVSVRARHEAGESIFSSPHAIRSYAELSNLADAAGKRRTRLSPSERAYVVQAAKAHKLSIAKRLLSNRARSVGRLRVTSPSIRPRMARCSRRFLLGSGYCAAGTECVATGPASGEARGERVCPDGSDRWAVQPGARPVTRDGRRGRVPRATTIRVWCGDTARGARARVRGLWSPPGSRLPLDRRRPVDRRRRDVLLLRAPGLLARTLR